MMEYQIILDVGGTGIKGLLHRFGASASDFHEYPAQADADRSVLIRHFCSICDELLVASGDCEPVCTTLSLAFPGPFDYERGIPLMHGLNKYESIYGVCLPEVFLEYWQANGNHCYDKARWNFLNDVSAFALGAIDRYSLHGRTMCVCLGTGTGSAFCINGKLCTNIEEGIPENGWIYPIPFEGAIIDEVLSARGISRLSERYCQTSKTPLQLFNEATLGNEQALAVWEQYGHLLLKGLTPFAEAFNADTLVLGGKIALASRFFLNTMEQWCSNRDIRLLIETDTSEIVIRGLMNV